MVEEPEIIKRQLHLGHIRMYIGLEDAELLIQDIQNALDNAYKDIL